MLFPLRGTQARFEALEVCWAKAPLASVAELDIPRSKQFMRRLYVS